MSTDVGQEARKNTGTSDLPVVFARFLAGVDALCVPVFREVRCVEPSLDCRQ